MSAGRSRSTSSSSTSRATRCWPVPNPVAVVGLQGGEWFGHAAGAALHDADVLIGSERHFQDLPRLAGERVTLSTPLADVLDLAEQRRRAGARVCVLSSGDPGFFGL